MSHLGWRVRALLDGRLSPAEEERCWSHVHGCHACRDLVGREGWVKTRLAGLSLGGLSLVALLAGLIPTMRALRINPVRALRQG